MLAKARGVSVVNLVRRDAGVDELTALGIENVLSTITDGWQDTVRALVGGQPIVAAVDSIGGQSSADLLTLPGENGTLVSFGTMGGEPMQIASGDLIFKQATVRGFWRSKASAALSADDKRRMIGALVTMAIGGELALPVEAIYAFEDAADAARASLQPGRVGKVMLKP